jgi:hypothetical protein
MMKNFRTFYTYILLIFFGDHYFGFMNKFSFGLRGFIFQLDLKDYFQFCFFIFK